MNIRIFWVRAMKCMCAQTRPRFILSSERVFGGMEFEPMLTPREKSPLPENVPRVREWGRERRKGSWVDLTVHKSWCSIGNPVRYLPDAISPRISWLNVDVLLLREITVLICSFCLGCGSMCHCLSKSLREARFFSCLVSKQPDGSSGPIVLSLCKHLSDKWLRACWIFPV